MGTLVLGLTALGIGALLIGALLSLAARRSGRMLIMLAAAGTWALLYGGALLVVSVRSETVVLSPGTVKRFCGFYLDCHLGVSVEGMAQHDSAAVVTLRVSSDAVRAALTPSRLHVALIVGGTRYSGLPAIPPEREVAAGGWYDVVLTFNVTPGALSASTPPRLLVQMGFPAERLIESVLIGDEDSFLHARTLLALPR